MKIATKNWEVGPAKVKTPHQNKAK
uniref:Uncharacterized protein n=1 Tax=Anguilla anguilla TaxID=7936 RepID=A0A0E9STM9_ANGAN